MKNDPSYLHPELTNPTIPDNDWNPGEKLKELGLSSDEDSPPISGSSMRQDSPDHPHSHARQGI